MKSLLGSIRPVLDKIVALVGVLIVLVQVLFMADTRTEGAIVLVGLFLIITGVWRLGGLLLPDRREYVRLRSEVEGFLRLVPDLHRHAVASDPGRLEETKRAMHESVERMADAASVREREG